MNKLTALIVAGLLVGGCRGEDPVDTGSFPVTPNPDAFATFLNRAPGVAAAGVAEGEIHNVDDFPEAYYNTIDPDNTRNSFEKWRIENGFLNPDGSVAACELPDCVSTHVKFRDTKDLGYGRNMFMRWDRTTDDIAVYVENFQVDAVPGIPYGPLNFEALVNGDRSWNFGVNAIEFSAYPATDPSARKFTKFYNFAGDGKRAVLTSGSQQHFTDLDGRGLKAMPTPCIVCHGGHGRTLVVEGTDGRKVLAPTITGGIPGDLQAHMQPIEFDTVQFSNEPGFTQADSEDGIRLINQAVLASYDYRQSTATQAGDWDGAFAASLLRGRYDGDPSNPANTYNSSYIPEGWRANPNAESIYNNLVGPNCVVCHALRGSGLNGSIGFSTFPDFTDYSDQTDHLVFERGLMPLGLLNYSDFWETSKNPALLAAAIGHAERISPDNTAIPPGSPVATLVAPRIARGMDADGASAISLSSGGTVFADTNGLSWSVEPAAGASIVTADDGPANALLRATTPGDYVVTLDVSGSSAAAGQPTTDSVSQTITVTDASGPLPAESALSFYATDGSGINDMLNNNGCVGCHSDGGGYPGIPVFFAPCRADGLAGGAAEGLNVLYRSVLARINFEAPYDSLLLRKATNGARDPYQRDAVQASRYHEGGVALDNDAEISRLVSWILTGANRGELPAVDTIPASAASCL